MSNLPKVTIYTDGGADPNPGVGGWGAVLLRDGSTAVELKGGDPQTTNNRMELMAAISALESLPERSEVKLFTDSTYVKQGITSWLPGWRRRGWKRQTGEIKNLDLWQRLSAIADSHVVSWHWVKGHAGNRYNERADVLATEAIREQARTARPSSGSAAPAATSPAATSPAAPRGPGLLPFDPPHTEPQAPVTGADSVKVEVEVYQRVSCAKGRGVWTALVRRGSVEETAMGAERGTTANQLDLLAACTVIEQQPKGTTMAVYTASDYLRNGATMWLPGWRRRGWRSKSGDPIANRELWQRLESAMADREVAWPSFKGQDLEEMQVLEVLAQQALRSV